MGRLLNKDSYQNEEELLNIWERFRSKKNCVTYEINREMSDGSWRLALNERKKRFLHWIVTVDEK